MRKKYCFVWQAQGDLIRRYFTCISTRSEQLYYGKPSDRKRPNLVTHHLHYAIKKRRNEAVKCRKTAYFTQSCANMRRFLRRNEAFQERT